MNFDVAKINFDVPRLFKHNKTGKIYFVLNQDVIDCTNGREDKTYTLYKNPEGQAFCRETSEFNEKFTEM